MKGDDLNQNTPKQDTLLTFIKETKDGKFVEVDKKILFPECAKTTILRQEIPEEIYYFSIS